MLEGDIGLEGLPPKEDPAAREYPEAAREGDAGGGGEGSLSTAALGDSGGGSSQGTEGHTRGGRQGTPASSALLWGVEGTLSASGV